MQVIQIEGSKKPLFSWCENPEQNALDQIVTIAKLPFVEHCAWMADGHMGMDAPIGSVVATNGILVPNWIGSDCGCGICVVKTSLKRGDIIDRELRLKILHSFMRGIPVGFNHNSSQRQKELEQKYSNKIDYIISKSGVEDVCSSPFKKGTETEIICSNGGTLGSGNHWASIEYDENDDVWLMVHSGSRNIGAKINNHFNDLAKKQNKMWNSVPSVSSFLPATSEEGKSFLAWMDFGLRFAFLNRLVIIEEMEKDLEHIMNRKIEYGEMTSIHHNYASIENHFGKNVYVHRKGATLAVKGQIGIIPGSQGTATFLVEGVGEKDGKGNPDSLYSCSHGAGRVMGRTEFNRQFNTQEQIEKIRDLMKDVVYVDFSKEKNRKGNETGNLDLSECPLAYKSIEKVMMAQKDLVIPIHKLMPMVNMKA